MPRRAIPTDEHLLTRKEAARRLCISPRKWNDYVKRFPRLLDGMVPVRPNRGGHTWYRHTASSIARHIWKDLRQGDCDGIAPEPDDTKRAEK